ncbi:MAG: TIGR04282 family arsenosugar biosynthesis glycosyltransferase [Rhodocyclaceae bacterium]|nr:TIGR04282 family arsenosugar biosynthesis glycosyltransferase [Rhodocyclaceae bacterium]
MASIESTLPALRDLCRSAPPTPANAQIAVFAKAPRAGYAKTRLAPLLGAAGAARLQRRMTIHALSVAYAARLGPVQLWCAPAAGERFFRALSLTYGVQCASQSGGDLGARMAAAFAAGFVAAPQRPVLLMGCDCPLLAPAHLHAAAAALAAGKDAAFVTAADGGYVLIGLNGLYAELFAGIEWGGPQVMADTRARMRRLGLVWEEVAQLWDVDTPQDVARLSGAGWKLPDHAA